MDKFPAEDKPRKWVVREKISLKHNPGLAKNSILPSFFPVNLIICYLKAVIHIQAIKCCFP